MEGTFGHHDHLDHSTPARTQRISTRARELGEGRYLVEGLDAEDGGEGTIEVTAALPVGGALGRAFVIPLPGSRAGEEAHP